MNRVILNCKGLEYDTPEVPALKKEVATLANQVFFMFNFDLWLF